MAIEHLQSRIVDIEPPASPTIIQDETLRTIEVADQICQLMFQGGQPVYANDKLQFTQLPTTITPQPIRHELEI